MALPTRVMRGYEPVDSVQRDFDGLMNRFFGQREQNGGNLFAPYGVDVREDADHLYVEAELPGFRKDEIEVTLENQTLTISAERKQLNDQKGDMLLNERRYTRFLRSFTLPPTISDQKCDAKLSDGVLSLTLNKREETKPRKIQVN